MNVENHIHVSLFDLTLLLMFTGVGGLFKGVVPRVIWISIGGFIFLGTYELSKNLIKI